MTQTNIPKRAPVLTAEVLDNMPARELKDKRWRFGKVFSLDGCNYQAVAYAKPVHYRNAQTDAWEEIDNTFVPGIFESHECLHNQADDVQVFCTASGSRPFLHLTDASGNRISYGVEGAAEVFPLAKACESMAEVSDTALFIREKALEKLEGTVRYDGIFPDVDMVCTASANGLPMPTFRPT
jgi:hypothetical protein